MSFPAFDMFHAHCGMKVVFETASCLHAFDTMKDDGYNWRPEPTGAKGTYEVYDATEEETLWVTRTTPTKKYVDDIYFNFLPPNTEDFNVKGCTVEAKSRSRSLSYYDYSTNFCNMWNVFNSVGDAASLAKLTTSDCQWVPKDPATTCAKY